MCFPWHLQTSGISCLLQGMHMVTVTVMMVGYTWRFSSAQLQLQLVVILEGWRDRCRRVSIDINIVCLSVYINTQAESNTDNIGTDCSEAFWGRGRFPKASLGSGLSWDYEFCLFPQCDQLLLNIPVCLEPISSSLISLPLS